MFNFTVRAFAFSLLLGGAVNAQAQDQSLFTTQTPALNNLRDGANINYELGMRFFATSAGQIKAIRFYKASNEAGSHIGRIFSSSGQQLASVTFTNETASGWQQQALSTPLSINANTEYVVSVNTGNGYYVSTNSGLANQVVNGYLKSSTGNNGVYGPVGSKPANSYQYSNYFRDVVFASAVSQPAVAWTNSAFASQTGSFTVQFDAVPALSNQDTVVGLSKTAATAYTDLATLIRFANNGYIDARNGASYAAAASVANIAGSKYHIRMLVDVAAKKYSVYVTPQGQAEVLLANNYAFRDSQSAVTSLANLAKYNAIGNVTISNFSLSTSPTTPPPTGGLTFLGDWAKDPVKAGWKYKQAVADGRLQLDSTMPTWHGKASAKVIVQPGDDPLNSGTGSERAEVLIPLNSSGQEIYENTNSGTQYYAFSYRFPEGWNIVNNNGWEVLLQLHGPDDLNLGPSIAISANQQALTFETTAGDQTTIRQTGRNFATIVPGKWMDFVMKVVHAKDSSGHVTIYRRDEGQSSFTSVLDMATPTLQYVSARSTTVAPHYWKQGIYRHGAGSRTDTMWMGAFARGTSFSAVEQATFGTNNGVVATAPPPPPPPPVTSTQKPDATNTGWQPTGASLKPSGSINVTADGTVIDGLDVSGTITIQASNVTIRRTRVSSSFYFPVWVKSGTNIKIEDSEVNGLGGPSDGGQKCIYVSGGSSITIQRNNLHDCEDGMSLNTTGLTVQYNWIHKPNGPASQHSDGMEFYTGGNALIQYNNFDYAGATTSATNFTNDFGPINGVTYDHNWLSGGAFNLYVDGSHGGGTISNVKITNNVFIKGSAAYGTNLIRGDISNVTFTGNVFNDGTPVN